MKSAGLSSTYRTMLKRTTKIITAATLQENHLASKEKQKSLRLQAARAQFERQEREKELLTEAASLPNPAPKSTYTLDSQTLCRSQIK